MIVISRLPLLGFRTGIFADESFLGHLLDGWIKDAAEFARHNLPHILVILFIAFLLTRLLHLITNRMIAVSARHGGDAGRVASVKTLSGIVRTTGFAVICVLVVLQLFAALGINLGPLLASAGIAGVAIGLAAQTIVKDLLNGMLIVLENQFNVGDLVRLAGMSGTVESMTLRKTTVRDADGTLYIVPNSQITTVANLSRDFSVATINVSVDFSANPDRVLEILTRVAKQIQEDPAYQDAFLADPQVLGVDQVKGSEMIFPVVFRTRATQQYAPMREFRRRVRLALEEGHLLPGDPNRVFREFSGTPADENASSDGEGPSRAAKPPRDAVEADPTVAKSNEINPFAAQ